MQQMKYRCYSFKYYIRKGLFFFFRFKLKLWIIKKILVPCFFSGKFLNEFRTSDTAFYTTVPIWHKLIKLKYCCDKIKSKAWTHAMTKIINIPLLPQNYQKTPQNHNNVKCQYGRGVAHCLPEL
jgi:hypothetical protein